MEKLPVPDELINFVDEHSSFLILSHIDPDGDCICSSLALGSFLQRNGKQVRYFNKGPFCRQEIREFKKIFSPEIPANLVKEKNAVLVLDCSTADRIGDFFTQIKKKPIAVIDHHSSGDKFGNIHFINPSAPSTSIMVQQLIERVGDSPTLEESEYIFFALATDTGFFRHLGINTQVTFEFVAKLIKTGTSPKKIYNRIFGGMSLASRQHLGLMLSRTISYFEGKFLYTWETYEDTAKFGSKNRDFDSLYQQLTGIPGVDLILVLREKESGKTTGNFRSSEKIDVGHLAACIGGGGHARAAGFSMDENLATCFSKVFPLAEKAILRIN